MILSNLNRTSCKYSLILIVISILPSSFFSQTFNWSSFPAGGTSYTTGIMTATITSSAAGFTNGAPKYYSGTTVGSGGCGIAGGLALEQFFGNISSAHVTLTLDFTGGNTNGTCSVISFKIKDINADESVQTFRDIVHISAIDANNNAIPVANIVRTGGANKMVTTSGNTRIIAGSSGSYGSRSKTDCDEVTITVTPPTGVPLRKIVIRYQPDYSSCASCYYNWTGPTRPAYQFISIGSITATASGGGCVVLPIELAKFEGSCEENQQVFEWITSTEINNDYFTLEKSTDGVSYTEAAKVQGAGNSNVNNYYKTTLNLSEENTYFRLKQTDYDGQFTYSKPVYVKCNEKINLTAIYPNPATDEIFVKYQSKNQEVVGYIINVIGERVKSFNNNSDNNLLNISIADLPKGLYHVILMSTRTGEFISSAKFIKK